MKQDIKQHLEYAFVMQKQLEIRTINGKSLRAKIKKIDDTYVHYQFSDGNAGKIKIENIIGCEFRENDEKEFREMLQCTSQNEIENFREYFLEILNFQKNHKKENEQKANDSETGEEVEQDFKCNVINKIFDGLKDDEDNLCNIYLRKKNDKLVEKKGRLQEIVLLQQSNLSQKRCIEAALTNRVSVIEGPPGTGKTTTILSIIANLVKDKKKVVVVSKNNSAINNIVEELEQLNLPEFYIRMGNKKVMEELNLQIEDKVNRYGEQVERLKETDYEKEKQQLADLYEYLNGLEENLNDLKILQNQYEELRNQQRHLEKRLDVYQIDVNKEDKHLKKANRNIEAKLARLNAISHKLDKSVEITFWEKVVFALEWKIRLKKAQSKLIEWQMILEYRYLKAKQNDILEVLDNENIRGLQEEIDNSYRTRYIEISKKVVESSLKAWKLERRIQEFRIALARYKESCSSSSDDIMRNCKNEIVDMYPVILTTVDSLPGNLYHYIQNNSKIDYIIMDEASQCDILSALPMLYMAKHIVVVGDSKQLSAITEKVTTIAKVPPNYDYSMQSFLDSVIQVFEPQIGKNRNMLLEHYRCDFKIINYCNKYFYDNQLIIYSDARDDAMELLDVSKGKYVERHERSFRNEREIVAIDYLIAGNLEHKFVITPFKAQSDMLKEKYNAEQCGTIHTFQGKGEREVYFSTVLNNIEEARKHLRWDNNMFSNELINVAVSRAKRKFVLVSDIEFLKGQNKNMRDLIEYIEVYGNEIPDKSVCVFDDLYKLMPDFVPTDKIDNCFEQKISDCLEKYLETKENLDYIMKIPLAEVVTDKVYLDANPEIKQFILNHAHIDFTIYDQRICKPLIAIELDGEEHKKEIQIQRDQKKNRALDHMNIKIVRVGSKEAFTEEELYSRLDKELEEIQEVRLDIE